MTIRMRPSILNFLRKNPSYTMEGPIWKALRESGEFAKGLGSAAATKGKRVHDIAVANPLFGALGAGLLTMPASRMAQSIEDDDTRQVVQPITEGLRSALTTYILSRGLLGPTASAALTAPAFASGIVGNLDTQAYQENYKGSKERSKIRKQIKKEKIKQFDAQKESAGVPAFADDVLKSHGKNLNLRLGQLFGKYPRLGLFGIPMALEGGSFLAQQSDLDQDTKDILAPLLSTAGRGVLGTGVGLALGSRFGRPQVGGLVGALLGAGLGLNSYDNTQKGISELDKAKEKRKTLGDVAKKELEELKSNG